jgi:penicillin-binding protein 1A
MGIRTPVSSNYAMTLGGLKQGVTPLDMAHAYETFIEGGRRIGGTLGASDDGPVGIDKVLSPNGKTLKENHPTSKPVLDRAIANETVGIMTTVISQGTGRRAALGPGQFAAGKTGTTENSGDAWFVGFTKRWTVAVWVGYADKLKPMLTEFAGAPVEGGTYPALIWHDFMTAADNIVDERKAEERVKKGLPPLPPEDQQQTNPAPAPSVPTKPAPVPEGGDSAPPAPQPTAPSNGGGGTSSGATGTSTGKSTTPSTTPPSSSGAGTGGTGGSGGASAPGEG